MIIVQIFYVMPTEHIYVFAEDLKKSDNLTKQRQLTDFYNPEGGCLLRRTNRK